jgi:threonine synthase
LRARRLGKHIGVPNLFLKDETRNPTASFKDRAMSVGAAKAYEMGVSDVVIASSGNAAIIAGCLQRVARSEMPCICAGGCGGWEGFAAASVWG